MHVRAHFLNAVQSLSAPFTSLSATAQTTRAFSSKDTTHICAEEKGLAVSLHKNREAQVLAQRQHWGGREVGRMTGAELKGIPSPEGTVNAESDVEISDSCFYHPR